MKGIVRKLDPLGRIVIPKEIRKQMGVTEGDDLEIGYNGKEVVVKKAENSRLDKIEDYLDGLDLEYVRSNGYIEIKDKCFVIADINANIETDYEVYVVDENIDTYIELARITMKIFKVKKFK